MDISVLDIIKEANNKGVKIVLDKGSLSVKSTTEIDATLIQKIKNNKASIIEYLEKYQGRNKVAVLEKITPYNRDVTKHIPLSFSQERLWFLDQLHGRSQEYHIPVVLRLNGDLDITILETSLRTIIDRHEVLRTVIYSEEGIGFQKIISSDDWSLTKVVLDEKTDVEAAIFSFLEIPFDLSSDYMLRACIYDLGEDAYVLALVFHHISSDGWSQSILVSEFAELYSALQSGQEAKLPKLSLQYSDYALWQREYVDGTVLENQLLYWEDKLKNVSPLLLPTDYARPSEQSNAGSSFSFELDKELSDALKALCKEEDITLFMMLLSAFKVLLSRYSNQDDICVGTPIANRTQSDLEGIIGFFVNTLALRSDLSEDPSFKEVLQQVRNTTLGGYDHNLAPFEKIVDRVAKKRDMSMSPLFQVLFALQNAPEEGNVDLEGLSFSPYEYTEKTSQFDLVLTAEEAESGISLRMEYCTALFKQDTIRRMMVHYKNLISSIVSDVTQSISSLSILSSSDEHQLLSIFNATEINYPSDKTLIDLFTDQVNIAPDAIALVFEEREMTYKELDEASNHLAHYLLSVHNIALEDLVGVKLERSEWLIVVVLGVLKSGGVYLPIDPRYPEDRISYIEKDSDCKIIIDEPFLESYIQQDTKYASTLPEINIKTDNLAYVIYTSGSTGKPKGVLIEHKGIVNTIYSQIDVFTITPNSNCLQFASQSFDASISEIFISILGGATLYIIGEDKKSDLAYFTNFITTNKITCATLPPAFFRLLDVSDLVGFDTLITAGEEAPLGQVLAFINQGGRYINAYGPTETSICATTFQGDFTTNVPIGKPIANTQIYIIDKNQSLLPIGVIGELCVGGAGLARGYLNRKDLTSEKFIDHPFEKGNRIYRTGDLARWLPNGDIEFVGRIDDQVKIRGYRIELGEIENILSSHPSITSSCVLARKDNSDNTRLIGYIVVENDLDNETIQEYLKEKLPEYMVPQLWVELDSIPLTSNGKIDKKVLPDPDMSTLSTKEYVAPRTEIEEQLAHIWQNLLGLDRVGIYDNFFELGGHSLLVVQLIAHLQKKNFQINVKEIFAHPTIDELAIKLNHGVQVYEAPENGIAVDCDYIMPEMVPLIDFNQEVLDLIMDRVVGGASNIQDIYPLAPLQEGIYFHHLISNKEIGDVYVSPNLISFSDIDKRSQFIEALKFVIARHDVLRTCILSEGLPHAVQVVLREVEVSVEKMEVSLDGSKSLLEELEAIMTSGIEWIDLSKAPMLQLKTVEDNEKGEYYILMNQHHIIIDHVGLEKITEEIIAYISGETAKLESPVLYRNFIAHTLYQQTINDSEPYFRSRLEKITEPTFPFGLYDLQDGLQIKELNYELSDDLSSRIRKVAHELHMSPATIFHAAWGIVLGVCSNQDHVIFGTVVSGRLQGSIGANRSLGLFINTLPLVLELECTIPEYFAQVNRELHGLLSYEQTSLTDIQSWSNFDKGVPLFSGLLNYRYSTVNDDTDDDFGIDYIGGHERTDYPLDLSIDDFGKDDGFGFTMQVDPMLDPARIISYMEEVLSKLIDGFYNNSEIAVNTLSIVPKEEQEILHLFNATAVDYPLDNNVINLFEKQAHNTPDAIALVFGDQQLTYKQLDEKSNQLAHYLREKGVKEETLIGICIERSLEMMVGILSILKAGGAYVPIKPDYPESRISHIINDTKCNVVLTDISTIEVLSNLSDIDKIIVDSDEYMTYPQTALGVSISSGSLSYVIYTSGSTGVPKGAMIEHRGLLNHLLIMIDELEMDSTSVVAFTAPFTFDISVWQLLSALLSGGRVVMYSERQILDATVLQESLYDDGVTHLQLVPSYVSELLDVTSNKDLSQLHYFLVTGEATQHSLLSRWFSRYPEIPVVNAYGPAEAADDVSLHIMRDLPKGSVIPIGKPVANMQLYVVNPSNQLCPIGVIGELWVSGVGVGRGYINDPEKTANSFIENPFTDSIYKVYKTGDLGRWLPDGTLEFVGRIDDQVKIHGYRIELGEIENVLLMHDSIQQCCVLAKPDSSGNNYLIGYVVTKQDFNKQSIQEHLKSQLPEYMIPMIWLELDVMPLTSNGKIDKKALPDPDTSQLSMQEYIAPRNDIEEKLSIIWKEVLDIDQLGVYDDFFELGGHSLLATRLISMIRTELDLEVEIADIFMHTTIEALALHLSTQGKTVLLPSITAYKKPERIPLSFSQERLWFIDQLQGSIDYHIPVILKLDGVVDTSILETALQKIITRHEVLRTIIKSDNGIGYQNVIPVDKWSLDTVVLDVDQDNIEETITSFAETPFDLSSDYMLRACIYDLGNAHYILAVIFHHIASDGWSEGVLVSEFMELYNTLVENKDVVLPELPIQYSDYALWQREYVDGTVLENQLSYWYDKLNGVTPLLLPTDYIRPSIQNTAGANISFELDKELTTELSVLCKEEGVTMFMVLLSGFKVLLSRYSGQDDICVGTPIANRTQSDLEGMIGFFVNTLALRSDLSKDPSFRDLLSSIKETTLGSYENQLAPFEKVVERVADTRDMSTSPLFQVMFDLQNIPEQEEGITLKDLKIDTYDEYTGNTSKFDLNLTAAESDSVILLSMTYHIALFTEATIRRMLVHYQELLRSIVLDCNQSISKLSILPEAERLEILEDFNATDLDYSEQGHLIDVFRTQVSQDPDRVALELGESTLTYRELEDASNRMVTYLRSENIDPGNHVGILFDRDVDMLISMLGILKSGCAYVPLDASLPMDRLTHIIEDAEITHILYADDVLRSSLDISGVHYLSTSVVSDYDATVEVLDRSMDSTAYVMYTSGSTGVPKGIMITDRNILTRINDPGAIHINSTDRVLQWSNYAFDGSTYEIYASLLNGASLHLISGSVASDAIALSEEIKSKELSVVFMTTALFNSLVDYGLPSVSSLRLLLFGGEQVSLFHARKALEVLGPDRLVHVYGPTEATVYATYYPINSISDTAYTVPIGYPLSNTCIYILNSSQEVLPIGVSGELCISGTGLAKGYLNREDLTKEQFIAHPFKEGERLYKTGDLARWLPDGSIEFVGRIDHQVKIRGYRIELGEIENVLSSHPLISSSCVVAHMDTSNNKRLVGYIVSEEGLDKKEIYNYLKKSLPEYMIPQLWVTLEAMPLTSNGKIDKKELPEPDLSSLSTQEYIAPRNETELQLSIIWQELLGLDQVGVYDDFFELGGHSLLATRLVSMIRKELGIEVSIRSIFMYSKLEELSTHISTVSDTTLLPAIVAQDRPDRIPLSFSQERLWFLDQLQGSLEYHMPIILRLEGDLNVTALETSFQTIVDRHEVLRTVIYSDDGIGYQKVIPSEEWQLSKAKLESEENLERELSSFLNIPFDLSKDYMFRACLYDLGDNNYVLAGVFHHIASDGWSNGILISEFSELYSAIVAGQDPSLLAL
ncbi:non-ribosomal peptide synthetase, partial [Aquimarina longa]|uniref:non-ribosomal peptide synthetase n=1 Tax=Aquimarina longa TaxID=1080221 RepID=UPI000A9B9BCF